jgi:hypothetical protein
MAVDVSMFQTVHVVSIDDVTTKLGAFSFQEKLVNGGPVDWLCTLDCWHTRGHQCFESRRGLQSRTPDSAVLSVNRCPPPVGCLPT